MATHTTSPPNSEPCSPKSTPASNSSLHELSLDLSNLPPLITPAPPSNTLLITNLTNPLTFSPPNLEKIRTLLSHPTPLNSFSPLRSLRRIIISYPTAEAAIHIRTTLSLILHSSASALPPPSTTADSNPQGDKDEDEDDHHHPLTSNNNGVKIYFGAPTPLAGQDDDERHLKAPSLGKLLFISPPPSPPCGWEIKEEDPPNKTTHAEDLERALAGLTGFAKFSDEEEGWNRGSGEEGEGTVKRKKSEGDGTNVIGVGTEGSVPSPTAFFSKRRRSGSTTVVYHPRTHGDREDLPAVMVEDTTREGIGEEEEKEKVEGWNPEGVESLGEEEEGGGGGRMQVHTARPPVELMEE